MRSHDYLVNLHVKYLIPLKTVNRVNKNVIDPFTDDSLLDMFREKLTSNPVLYPV